MTNGVVPEGAWLIKEWLSAKDHLARTDELFHRAQCAVKNTETALATWLMPDDMKVGEKIAVWHGSSLFQVELVSVGEPIVTVRTRGKAFGT